MYLCHVSRTHPVSIRQYFLRSRNQNDNPLSNFDVMSVLLYWKGDEIEDFQSFFLILQLSRRQLVFQDSCQMKKFSILVVFSFQILAHWSVNLWTHMDIIKLFERFDDVSLIQRNLFPVRIFPSPSQSNEDYCTHVNPSNTKPYLNHLMLLSVFMIESV